MRIAKVLGTVTLNRMHPTLVGGRFKFAVPLSQEELAIDCEPNSDQLVVYDEFGANINDLILLSEGAEAAQPFYPEMKPIDAYNAGILDNIQIEPVEK